MAMNNKNYSENNRPDALEKRETSRKDLRFRRYNFRWNTKEPKELKLDDGSLTAKSELHEKQNLIVSDCGDNDSTCIEATNLDKRNVGEQKRQFKRINSSRIYDCRYWEERSILKRYTNLLNISELRKTRSSVTLPLISPEINKRSSVYREFYERNEQFSNRNKFEDWFQYKRKLLNIHEQLLQEKILDVSVKRKRYFLYGIGCAVGVLTVVLLALVFFTFYLWYEPPKAKGNFEVITSYLYERTIERIIPLFKQMYIYVFSVYRYVSSIDALTTITTFLYNGAINRIIVSLFGKIYGYVFSIIALEPEVQMD